MVWYQPGLPKLPYMGTCGVSTFQPFTLNCTLYPTLQTHTAVSLCLSRMNNYTGTFHIILHNHIGRQCSDGYASKAAEIQKKTRRELDTA